MSINVLIADDHFSVRLGMEVIVRETLGLGLTVDFAKSGTETLEKIGKKPYNLLISDINMPDCDIKSLIVKALDLQPQLKILVLSVNPREIYAPFLMKFGIFGYIAKSENDQQLKKAIWNAHLGKKYIPEEFRNTFKTGKTNPFSTLSDRELEVANLLLKGLGVIEIGNSLNLNASTSSTYKSRIFKKLQVRSVIELSILARRFNFMEDEPPSTKFSTNIS